MIELRRSHERGHFDHGWLDTYHTFSFADYHDPRHMGFRSLRVINDDRIGANTGFPRHGHRDMEILTVVLDGVLAHQDSLGNGSEIRPGEIQRMTAGTGILHSEYNAASDHPLHLMQIWIHPEQPGLVPSYEQRTYDTEAALVLIASKEGKDGAARINQDARVYHGRLRDPDKVSLAIEPGRHVWLHVIEGRLDVNGHALSTGDAAAITDEPEVRLRGDAQYLIFDLA